VVPGIRAHLGYETNVTYRLQNKSAFKVDLNFCLRARIPVRRAYERDINMNYNNEMLQKQL
jgi:hypothetical protein